MPPTRASPGEDSHGLLTSVLFFLSSPCCSSRRRVPRGRGEPRRRHEALPAARRASCCCPRRRPLLKELKDDKDRREFQKIFWARRDPTPGTPANEFEDNVRAVWKHADELFSYPNQKGSETGCGQVLALLGRPEEVLGKGDAVRTPSVQRHAAGRGRERRPAAPGPGRQFDNMAYLREGADARAGDLGLPRPARPPLLVHGSRAARSPSTPSAGSPRGGILGRRPAPRRGGVRHAARHRLQPRERRAPRCRSRPRRPRAPGRAPARRRSSPPPATTSLSPRSRSSSCAAPKGEAYVAGLVRAVGRRDGRRPPASRSPRRPRTRPARRSRARRAR